MPRSTHRSTAIEDLPDFVVRSDSTSLVVDAVPETTVDNSLEAEYYWSDTKMGEYLASNPEPFAVKHYTYKDVKINPDLTPTQKAELMAVLEKHKVVFDTPSLPRANKVYTKVFGAVDLKQYMREDATPVHTPPQHFPPHHGEYLNGLRLAYLEHEIVCEWPDSPYAARSLVATRQDGAPRHCGDFRGSNAGNKAYKVAMPDGLRMLNTVSQPRGACASRRSSGVPAVRADGGVVRPGDVLAAGQGWATTLRAAEVCFPQASLWCHQGA